MPNEFRWPKTRQLWEALGEVETLTRMLADAVERCLNVAARCRPPEDLHYATWYSFHRVSSPESAEERDDVLAARADQPSQYSIWNQPFDNYHRVLANWQGALKVARDACDAALDELDAGEVNPQKCLSVAVRAFLGKVGAHIRPHLQLGDSPLINPPDTPAKLRELIREFIEWSNKLKPAATTRRPARSIEPLSAGGPFEQAARPAPVPPLPSFPPPASGLSAPALRLRGILIEIVTRIHEEAKQQGFPSLQRLAAEAQGLSGELGFAHAPIRFEFKEREEFKSPDHKPAGEPDWWSMTTLDVWDPTEEQRTISMLSSVSCRQDGGGIHHEKRFGNIPAVRAETVLILTRWVRFIDMSADPACEVPSPPPDVAGTHVHGQGAGGELVRYRQPQFDDAFRKYLAKNSERFAHFKARIDAGEEEAKTEARRIFGRNAVQRALRCKSPAMVSDSAPWRLRAEELGLLDRQPTLPKGQRVGLEHAEAQAADSARDRSDPSHSVETEDELRHLMASLPPEARSEVSLGLENGSISPEKAREIVLAYQDNPDDRGKD